MPGIKAFVKPELLAWARERAKVKIDDAAKAVNVSPERIEQWETGADAPTVNQLRGLAKKYHFPLAVFYLPEPPVDFAPLRDFRRLPNFEDGTISPNLAFHIRNAHERREVALELNDELRDEPQTFALKTALKDDPEDVGQKIRDFLGIEDEAQKKAAHAGRPFDFWRRKMEEHDILVFVVSGPHYSVELLEMRGFAIAKPQLPVIVVNGKDYSQGGRAFTLLHELTHILLGESAISNGSVDNLNDTAEEQRIERFCDAVAAAALMPRRLLLSFPNVEKSSTREWNDDELRKIAQAIGVSRHALLLRFVTIKRATWDYYKTQRARFDEEARNAAEKAAQQPKKTVAIPRPTLVMSQNGRGYTRLVFRGYYEQRITLNDVSNYLGAKVKYIPDLERAAFHMTE
jgi:Zn-dependent peptidase ImmA (M78 family)/DNA-binding XRE family transcriptional regulator